MNGDFHFYGTGTAAIGSGLDEERVLSMLPLNIKLGTSINLTLGFNPDWVPGDPDKTGLFFSPMLSLEEKDFDFPSDTDSFWSYPQISIYDTAESLLSNLFPFKVIGSLVRSADEEITTGSLLIGDHDCNEAIQSLSKTLGVNIGNSNYGFVLVQLRKEIGSVSHPTVKNGITLYPHPLRPDKSFGVVDKFRSNLIKLRSPIGTDGHFDPSQFTVEHAQKYLSSFQTYGTHFISQVMFGDCIFQVFAYEQNKFKSVKRAFNSNNFTGENAMNFLMYTTDANTGTYGYVKEYGNILSFSGDLKLKNDLEANVWQDKYWSENNSIFAPYIDGCNINSLILNSEYTEIAPINYNLTTLAIFLEFERRKAWKRVFKSAMVQKFKQAITPHFESYFPYSDSTLPSYNDIPGFVSTIATTNVNTYKPIIDLGDLQFVASEKNCKFTLCANMISSTSSEIQIPGNDIMFAFQTAKLESNENITNIIIDDDAFFDYSISCFSFYGCLQISNRSCTRSETICDGLRYVCDNINEYGRYLVSIKDDIRIAPDVKYLPRLKDNLSFAYTYADSIIGGCNYTNRNDPSYKFAEEAMRWLGEIIPDDCTDMDMIELRVSALDAVRMVKNPSQGTFVPLLPPENYQQQVTNILNYSDAITAQINQYQEIIDTRKTQELIIDVGKTLNDDIIQTGQLLVKFIQANADQQRDLSSYYQSVISQKQDELRLANDNINKMQISVDEQRINVSNAVEAYKQAVSNWETQQEIQFGLDVATTFFSAVTSIIIPASSINAVKELGLTFQRIQKLLNILNNTYKVYTTVNADYKSLNNAQTALNDLDGCDFDVNSYLAWDELNTNMTCILNCGPNIDAKSELQKEFSILVLRGKALLSAKNSATQIAKEVYDQQRLNSLSQFQQVRLDQLSDSLKPENIPSLNPLSLDLIGMTSSLIFLRTQMLGTLAKTFLLQDQSLQYRNLQPATVINSFDLLNFKGAIVNQQQNTMNALTKLKAIQESTTTEINVCVKVPVNNLIDGNSYSLNITPDNINFYEYVCARVQSVVVNIDGISSTESGKYIVKLDYPGNSFVDRDTERNPIFFRTVARERIYEFIAGTNEPNFSDKGQSWSDGVNPISPFSTWNISLPNTSINKGLKFNDVFADVSLKFILNARIVDTAVLHGEMSIPLVAEKAYIPLNAMSDEVPSVSPDTPPIESLIGNMSNCTVLNGWDVVFNMALNKIQSALNEQYDQLKESTSYATIIDVTTESHPTSKLTTYKKFKVTYGYPKLSFMENDTVNINLEIPILDGYVQNGSQNTDQDIDWDDPVVVDPDALILATVPLGQIEGTGNSDQSKVLSIAIDMQAGTFTSKNMTVDNDDDKSAFNTSLINYFTNNKVQFILNSLDLSNISILPDLCPNKFLFKTLITRTCKNRILQLFITTANRDAQSYSQAFINNVDEPIPLGNECSLMISSKVFFDNVLPNSLNTNGWCLIGINPGNITGSWNAKFTQGNLAANVDLSSLNHSETTYSGDGYCTNNDYSYFVSQVNNSVDGMTLFPNTNAIGLEFHRIMTQSYTEHIITTYPSGNTDETDNPLSTDYTLDINANMSIGITGTGMEQKISISMSDDSCVVSGHLSGGGPCGCDDLDARFNQQINQQLPGQIVGHMNISFNEISLFALKNLLFVNNNYINFKSANIPGDFLITGNFNQ
uniref:hypothetical protein n=1 Tax=Acetivibrio cellulolyticus TaxID=35830 RepID=UPI0001E2C1C7|nr:hypothetical protein [Acetivibrio cellulolyticus]